MPKKHEDYHLDGMFRAFKDTGLLIKWYSNNVYLAKNGARDIRFGLEATAIAKVLKERNVNPLNYEPMEIEDLTKFRNRLLRQFERIAKEGETETLYDCYYGLVLLSSGDVSSDTFGVKIFWDELKRRKERPNAPATLKKAFRFAVDAFLCMAEQTDTLGR